MERKILAFLKENPGANAREIAEALGISYSRVQSILYRLREKGIIIKTGFGYAVSSLKEPLILSEEKYGEEKHIPSAEGKLVDVLDKIRELKEKLDTLLAEYRRLDKDVKLTTEKVNSLQKKVELLEKKVDELAKVVKGPYNKWKEKRIMEDKLISELKRKGVLDISVARSLALKSIEEYVRSGRVVVISSLVVSKEFFDEFKKKFPIPKDHVKNLSEREKVLLRALVDEGLAYLYRGIEYRLV